MITAELQRLGHSVNHKRVYRIYRKLGLQRPVLGSGESPGWRAEKGASIMDPNISGVQNLGASQHFTPYLFAKTEVGSSDSLMAFL